jgi:formamidopyrimidine-DNA glycosylase
MPELPEVETIRRQLQRHVVGKKIVDVRVLFAKKLNVSAATLVAKTKGVTIRSVERRAKLLLINLSNGYTLAIHLKMTGRVLLRKAGETPNKYAFVVFKLSGGPAGGGVNHQLVWEDMRRFGFLKLFDEKGLERYLAEQGYGPEPLERSFSTQVMGACLMSHPGKKVKQLLMEQTCIAGIGNIYAVEALWYARINPQRAAGKLTARELKDLHDGVQKILKSSIVNRGTSADAYVDLFGKEGTFVPKLKVYDRAGERCSRQDGGIIRKMTLGGRGTYWCPVCQK